MNRAADDPGAPPFEFAACSDVGRVRVRNEDVIEVRQDWGWAVLADGMGGYRGGEVAARIAVAATLRRLEYEADAGRMDSPEDAAATLTSAVGDANTEIHRAGHAMPDLAGMGTTLVAAVFFPDQVVVGHVGDSRAYRLRGSAIEQLTRDHTILQEQVDGGMMTAEDARRSRYRGVLTRGVGIEPVVMPELGVHQVGAGDLFLICSDGLTDMLDDGEIAAAVGAGGSLPEMADRLVDLANQRGGLDNVSVILARHDR